MLKIMSILDFEFELDKLNLQLRDRQVNSNSNSVSLVTNHVPTPRVALEADSMAA